MAKDNEIRPPEDEDFKEVTERRLKELIERVELLERPYHVTPEQPIVDVDMDDNFTYELVDGHLTVELDVDQFRDQFPFPPTTDTDRYQHCTDPQTFSEIFLPASYADGVIAGGLADVIFKVTINNGGQLCYFLVQRGVNHLNTPGAVVDDQIDTCDACVDSPQSGDTGDQGIPHFDGTYVTDVVCANDGSGDLIVSKYNSFTDTFTIENVTGCCCDSGDSGGDSGDTMDRWSVCAGDAVGGDDIFLNTEVKDDAKSADPVIQLELTGCCYELAERETTGNIETAWNKILYTSGCSDERCGCPVDCFDVCQNTPTNTPTGVGSGACAGATAASMPNSFTFSQTATYFQWSWSGNHPLVGVDVLTIRCHKTTGEVAGNINNTTTDPSWGGADSVWSGFKVITGSVSCSGSDLSGSFALDGLDGGCEAETWTITL